MKISKTFRLSEEAVAILESKHNASRFIEDLILKGGEGISRGESMILDKLDMVLKPYGSASIEDLTNAEYDLRGNSVTTYSLETKPAVDKLPTTRVPKPDILGGPPDPYVTATTIMVPPCCFGKSPCKHWAYDGLKEAYVNSISGEIKEI